MKLSSRLLPLATLMAALAASAAAGAAIGSAEQKLMAADANHDGQLSRTEAQAHPHLAKNFDAIDTNHDGQLSGDELRAWHAAHPGKGGAANGGKGFQKLDTNADGKIERSEVANDPKKAAKFDAADTNHDGVVTKDEARAARAAHRAASSATH